MGAFLKTFEVTAHTGHWPVDQWSVFLRSSLSGIGMMVVSSLPIAQADYETVKRKLLALSSDYGDFLEEAA